LDGCISIGTTESIPLRVIGERLVTEDYGENVI
jgi:hypothetical protein